MIKNLPNFISIYRLVTIPFVAWFLLEELYNYAALFTLLIAVSDFLDGFIARYFKVQSELGSYLDAIADKAFVISIFILIGNLELLPVFIIIIIISRDIIILGSFANDPKIIISLEIIIMIMNTGNSSRFPMSIKIEITNALSAIASKYEPSSL